MPIWEPLLVAGVVLAVTAVVARLIDRAIARRELDPAQATRYRIVRRSATACVYFVGILSALLVIPEVRAVAGAILASSAVIGIIVGFASQRTLGNFIAGLLIGFAQPLRLGDLVEVRNETGVVEEIGLTYTFIRTARDDRIVVPNETLASDTIRNATIRSRQTLAEITVQVPLTHDLGTVVELLREETKGEQTTVFVSDLGETAVVTVRTWADSASEALSAEHELRLRTHERLRAAGVFA